MSQLANNLDTVLALDKCAVLVIDKQNAYIDPEQPLIKVLNTSTETLQSTMKRLDLFIKSARELNLEIIWTQMIEGSDESPANIASKMSLNELPWVSRRGDPSFDFYGDVTPVDGEKVVIKQRYDAFIGTDLDSYLKNKAKSTLVLTGGYVSRCMLATAFVGNSLGYNIVFATDLVGVPEKLMDELPIALRIVDSILGYTLSSNKLLNFWSK